MSKFKKGKTSRGASISTASLPDIVFMLLFFFMVATKMKETDPLVSYTQPNATEIQELDDPSMLAYVYVGPPKDKARGTKPVIQLNDQIAAPEEIPNFIEDKRNEVGEENKTKIRASLKIDKETKMGTVTDIKQELRKIGQLKINYSTLK